MLLTAQETEAICGKIIEDMYHIASVAEDG